VLVLDANVAMSACMAEDGFLEFEAYDAEYLALASLLKARVVTLDARFRRGADRTGLVVTPLEL
jgi:hypothetical protein